MHTNKRTITISGKTNVDSLTKKKTNRIRKVAQDENISHSRELEIVSSLILNTDDNYAEKANSFLKAKINSYKQQDIARSLYDENQLISLHDVIHKLRESNLKCYYCNEEVKIMYRTVRDPKQWTLDRIDNNNCHSTDNTVIACLECNLKRRVTDKDKFEFTKKLVVKKIEYSSEHTE